MKREGKVFQFLSSKETFIVCELFSQLEKNILGKEENKENFIKKEENSFEKSFLGNFEFACKRGVMENISW